MHASSRTMAGDDSVAVLWLTDPIFKTTANEFETVPGDAFFLGRTSLDEGVNDEMNEVEKVVVNDEANKQNNEDCTNKELNVENVEELDNNISDSKECNSEGGMVSGSNCANCYVNTSKDDCCTNDCDDANDMKRIRADGREVVIFDEDLVMKGSRKWSLTLCGQFVGLKMTYSELRYNLVRMWGNFGLKEIVTQNGVFLFKFRENEGMDFVLENRPWMVNNKPLMSGNENDVAKGNGIKGNEKTEDGFKRVRNGTKTIQPEWVMGKAKENLKDNQPIRSRKWKSDMFKFSKCNGRQMGMNECPVMKRMLLMK
ncbi:RNA-directed DNA polymerase, eukaryota, reverse transcriptase zinc-binding domain protein [Tanacetum coccineum]